MKVTESGAWSAARKILESGAKRIREAESKAVLQEAQFFRTKIVEGLRSGAPGGEGRAVTGPSAQPRLLQRRELCRRLHAPGACGPAL